MRPAQVARYRTRMPVEVSVPERMGYFFLSRDRPAPSRPAAARYVRVTLHSGEIRSLSMLYLTKNPVPRNSTNPPIQESSLAPMKYSQEKDAGRDGAGLAFRTGCRLCREGRAQAGSRTGAAAGSVRMGCTGLSTGGGRLFLVSAGGLWGEEREFRRSFNSETSVSRVRTFCSRETTWQAFTKVKTIPESRPRTSRRMKNSMGREGVGKMYSTPEEWDCKTQKGTWPPVLKEPHGTVG